MAENNHGTDAESNFDFLAAEWPELFAEARRAERSAVGDPRVACFFARRALELAVNWLYQADASLRTPYRDDLSAKLKEPTLVQVAGSVIVTKMDVVRRRGNVAVHRNGDVAVQDSVGTVAELFHVLYWLGRTYARTEEGKPFDGQRFDTSLIPRPLPEDVRRKKQAEIRQMADDFAAQQAELATERRRRKELDDEVKLLRAQVKAAKAANATVPDHHDYSEAQTRTQLIDLLLLEAGWALDGPDDREYPVTGMPTTGGNSTGKGRIDYVLWDDNGKPLAVVEAKRTSKSVESGKYQASLYADALEQQHGQRPVIFYTNGYETQIWDDTYYPPRPIQGFYTKEQLQLLIRRRAGRRPLTTEPINEAIAGRGYQKQAIERIDEAFEKDRQRAALLVMATGTGKTRTVIALVDQLMRAGWVKRVLFLADRQVLVTQATNAFKQHLPSAPTVNLLTDKDSNARVYVSTYPTMLNLINEVDDANRRPFGPGFFDLVIIDEAHRSVYQKYGAIFEHFDSLLVGLTATPKNEIDRNTYRLFHLEEGVPTDSYDLEQAIADGWLVPPQAKTVPLKFIRSGIRYDELSDEEKEYWEDLDWRDDDDIPDQVDAHALNQFLFNHDTVDQMLLVLMENGDKVADGERIGKTIIFARNNRHAELIVQRFRVLYPDLPGDYIEMITHSVSHAQSLIDKFENPDSAPHIAVSVDMLDTGLDVPAVVNLVFAKAVRSNTKYWQMIGRGTRLCPDLYAPNRDKQRFLIFDLCQNVEYFNQDLPVADGRTQPSISEKLFAARADLLRDLDQLEAPGARPADIPNAEPTDRIDVRWQLAERLRTEVASMNTQNVEVRKELQYVEKFSDRDNWDVITPEVRVEVGKLAGLPTQFRDDDPSPAAKRFDLLALRLQLAHLTADTGYDGLREKVQETAQALLDPDLNNITAIRQRHEFIEDVAGDAWWEDVTLAMLETMRRRLRGLVKAIPSKGTQNPLYTDFRDQLGDIDDVEMTVLAGGGKGMARFESKVRTYLRSHEDVLAVQKLLRNKQITSTDLSELEQIFIDSGFGTAEDIEHAASTYGGLGLFLRTLTGLDTTAATAAFEEFHAGRTLSANQLHFLKLLITYITKNGVIEVGALYEPPFNSVAPTGPEDIFSEDDVDRIVAVVKNIRTTAVPNTAESAAASG
ncbi:restriction endonuclease subunit R [Nocardia nova]|uniref:Restriction endonuclease subunit R n=1 Tax=Nocardia nova TaxID=37330 RepID=A0A2S6AJ15_9NOCA|nr:DEAD/DEAH box helicase family protein [Nocardia nova]PPJ35218.1 restriction endonuclease subunit R [Nocardia nova]